MLLADQRLPERNQILARMMSFAIFKYVYDQMALSKKKNLNVCVFFL